MVVQIIQCCISSSQVSQIIKYLHDNNFESSPRVPTTAAENAHLNIIQYYHDNEMKWHVCDVLQIAALHGHLNIIKWIFKHRHVLFTSPFSTLTIGIHICMWDHTFLVREARGGKQLLVLHQLNVFKRDMQKNHDRILRLVD